MAVISRMNSADSFARLALFFEWKPLLPGAGTIIGRGVGDLIFLFSNRLRILFIFAPHE